MFTLSQHLSDRSALRDLAIKGLHIKSSVANNILTNNPHEITEAAYRILNEWRMTQADGMRAYINLRDALNSVELTSIAKQVFEQ